MASDILSYATATVTQGGADTFTQGTITTGLSNQNFGWSIREILVEWGAVGTTGIGAGALNAASNLGLSFSVKSLSAQPLVSDKSVLFAAKKSSSQLSAVGFAMADKVWRYAFDANSAPIWVPDPIYVQNFSTNTAVAFVLNVRLGYVSTRLTDAQKAGLLLAALQQ